jgi:hypothetical protein
MITYSYNAAARLTAAQDVAGGVNYATAASYSPGGALVSLSNGASLVSTYFYNSRLQPCRISVKASGSAPANCDDLTQTGNVLDFRYGFNLGTANNGNAASIENRRDTGRSQSFTYDELNRIRDFSYGPCANQYTVDVWGNLSKMLALPGSGKPTCDYLDQSANDKNQFAGFSYDAAGNLQAYAGGPC